MAVRHRALPVDGVQFHPESVLTPARAASSARNFLERDDPGGARRRCSTARDLDARRRRARSMDEIMAGEATPAQIGGFLVALRMKGETPDEIAGFAEAIRAHVPRRPPAAGRPRRHRGTGGDGAGDDQHLDGGGARRGGRRRAVAKHGNRAVSSASGSADVLEALGFALELPPERIARSIDELGFGFLFAPTHHPAFRHAAPVRRELATRTVFNVLGPLTNPAGARAQVVGVYDPELVRTIAEVLARLGARRAFVVHGAFGDRRALAGRAEPRLRGRRRRGARARRSTRSTSASRAARRTSCAAARPSENAAAIRAVFSGEERARKRDAILLNAAGAIAAGGHADDLRDGLEVARETVDSGAAAERLDALVAFSHDGSVPGRARRARPRRDRRGQAPLAVGRRPPPGRRPGRARRGVRARRRGRRLGARRRALRRHRSTTSRAARAAAALPLLAKGFFSTEERTSTSSARPAPTPRCCSCATSTTARRAA